MTEPAEVLTVPVVNVNYLPEGIVALEGTVPGTPIDDPTLVGIKTNLEEQGLISGEDAAAANAEAEAALEVQAQAAEPTSEEDTSTGEATEPEPEPAQPEAVPYVKP